MFFGALHLTISGIKGGQVTVDVRLDFFHSALQFGAGEIAVAVVLCIEFAPVDGQQFFAKQPQPLAQHNTQRGQVEFIDEDINHS